MTIDEAVRALSDQITTVSSAAVLRVQRVSHEEAAIRVYAPADDEAAIRDAVRDSAIQLLTEQGLDVQVLVYDIATSLPPDA
jgi:hypothetical protein